MRKEASKLVGVIVILFTMLMLPACGDDDSIIDPGNNPTVTVGSGTTPQISWDKGKASFVSVSRVSDEHEMWQVDADGDTDVIASPATYGTVPANATERTTAEQLTAGVKYKAVVTVGANNGSVEFTP